MDEVDEARRQIEALPSILKEDFRISLIFRTEIKEARSTIFPEILHLIEEAFGDSDYPPKIITQRWVKGSSTTDGLHKVLIGFTSTIPKEGSNNNSNDLLVESSSDTGSGNYLQGIVIGPESNRVAEARRFRVVWAGGEDLKQKDICQLRRFKDGTIRESVTIPVSSWGGQANDFVLDKVVHLISVHHPSIEVQVHRGFKTTSPWYTVISDAHRSSKRNAHSRKTVQSLLTLLSECSTPELPIRKSTASCSCLHNGDLIHQHQHESHNVPVHFWSKGASITDGATGTIMADHQIAEKSKLLPFKCQPIPIIVDVTTKSNFSTELFQRLAHMHLIQLSHQLSTKYGLQSILYNNQLVVEYNRTLFGVMVQMPIQLESNGGSRNDKMVYQQASVEALHDRLKTVSSRHPCWWSAGRLIRLWIASSYLQSSFPEMAADLLLAVILDGSVESFNDTKPNRSFSDLSPPSSMESAFIRFLHHLAFVDFENTIHFLDRNECRDLQSTLLSFTTMKNRSQLPPLIIVTPHDAKVSYFTHNLSDRRALQRIINCARHSLQVVLKSTLDGPLAIISFDELFEKLPEKSLASYDAVISLKPVSRFQQAKMQTDDDGDAGEKRLILAAFDVVEMFLLELKSAFETEDNVLFHYNPEVHNIGVKLLRTLPNADPLDIKSLIQDIKIMGKGFVTNVDIMTSDNEMDAD